MADRSPRLAVCGVLLALAVAPMLAQERGIARVPAPVGPDGQIEELYTGSHALLVGVSRYQDPTTWVSLESIPNELSDLEQVLKAQGFQSVQRVMDPTGKQLRDAIDEFKDRYGFNEGHRLFFFFAGHGYTLGSDGFFVPSDAPDPLRDKEGFRRVALSMVMIQTWAEVISARHALFAFDSCFSGTIFHTRGDRPPVQRLSPTTKEPVRQFLSAGGAGERVPSRSVFTPAIVRALSGDGDIDGDGFVTGTELGNFVQRRVIESGKGQTPQFAKISDSRLDQGEIVFRPATMAGTTATAAAASSGASAVGPVSRDAATVVDKTAADRAAIGEALNEYRRAYEARSLPRLQRVFPTLPDPEDIAMTFANAREVRVNMSSPEIRIVSPTEASATAVLSYRYTFFRVGFARPTPPRTWTFTLRKDTGRWVIESRR